MANNYGLEVASPVDGMMVNGGQRAGVVENMVGSREVARVKGQVFMAKQFPRDEVQALQRITNACKRPALAEVATYSFPRGNQTVSGPSIRLAEVLIQSWGNADFGFVELERTPSAQGKAGNSVVEAYAWDLENNTRRSTTFTVQHSRDTKRGVQVLTDERDIYEMVANQASRRVRGCILQLIPADIVDAAVDECRQTRQADMGDPAKLQARIKKLIDRLAAFKVTEPMLSKYFGGRLRTQWTSADVEKLIEIGTSISDGVATPADYFDDAKATQKISDSQRAELMLLASDNPQKAIEAVGKLGFNSINAVTVAEFEAAKEIIKAALQAEGNAPKKTTNKKSDPEEGLQLG